MRNSLLTMGLIALLTFTGCQKDDPPPPTKTELISRDWKVTAMTAVFPAPIGTVDILSQLDACEKDNIIKIKADGTYTVDEGATKCDPTDPQTVETGNWAFTSNETKLTILDDTWDIVSLSATSLVLKQDTPAGGGFPGGTLNFTLTAQ